MAEEKVKTADEIAAEKKVEEDLVTRVSQVKTETEKQGVFDINALDTEIEKITDPKMKEQMVGLKKSLISGENTKYQKIAELRKDYETKLSGQSNWTSEKVQTLLGDPTFVKAAQDIMGTSTTQDEGSMLSDTEKASLKKINDEHKALRQQVTASNRSRQDEANKGKYANYNSGAVDIITADLLSGKVQATREDLWKVHDYEPAVKRAYKLGKEDRKLETGDLIESVSIEGTSVTKTEAPPKQDEGESDTAYWQRLGKRNLKKFQDRRTKKE